MFCALSWHRHSQFTILQLRKINRSQTNPCQQIHVFVGDFRLYIHACLLNDMMSQVVDLLNTIQGTRMTTTYLLLSSCYPIVLVFSSKNVIHCILFCWLQCYSRVVGNGQILIIITSRFLKHSNFFSSASRNSASFIFGLNTPPYLYEYITLNALICIEL